MKRTSKKLAAMMECRRIGKVLQSYLDGNTDEHTARRVAAHLDACRRCGFEAATYRELKASLSRHGAPIDAFALTRLRVFAASLMAHSPGE
jgi:anti-sigma factor RsiW